MKSSRNDVAIPTAEALQEAKTLQLQERSPEKETVGVPWKFWAVAASLVAISAGGFFSYQQVYKKQAEQLLIKAEEELSSGRTEEGLVLLREAASAHSPQAQYQLAEVLTWQYVRKNGQLPQKDDQVINRELFSNLEMAVQAGLSKANYLASLFYRDSSSEKQQQLGLTYLNKAAESGLFIARLEVATGLGKKYVQQPAYISSLADSAALGWHVAQVEQASLAQAAGDGIHAKQWLEQAQQDTQLRDHLVFIRRAMRGDSAWSRMEKDYQAIATFRLAALSTESSNRDNSLHLLQRAANDGLPAAQLALAERYLDVQGGYWQPEKARVILGTLANHSLPLCKIDVAECAASVAEQAKFKLAVNHYLGVQGFDSVNEAFNYLQASNAQGNADATYLLGWVLLNGRGVAPDVSRGITLIGQAAIAGIPGAKVTLAKCYLQGTGVAQDKQRARILLEEAAAKGDIEAKQILQKIGGGSQT